MISPRIDVFPASEYPRMVANLIGEAVLAEIQQRGSCRLGLAGGGTPGPVYERLASPTWCDRIKWDRVHLLWGDERCVPPTDPQSNFHMAQESLTSQVSIPTQNVHRIHGEDAPVIAAANYRLIVDAAPIDILLLGMGSDGHTASLFPATSQLKERKRSVVATTSPFAPYQRISLTVPAINRARTVCLLVTGSEKASRLAEVLQQINAGHPELPSSLVQPTSGQLLWLIDDRAAAQL